MVTKKIKIDGEEYPFHFGTGAAYLLGIETDMGNIKLKDLGEVMQDLELNQIATLLWCGLKSGASKAEESFNSSKEEVAEMLKEDPYALDQAMDIVHGLEEEYSEDIEGKLQAAKGEQ